MSQSKSTGAPQETPTRITIHEMVERLRTLPAPPSIEKREEEDAQETTRPGKNREC